MTKQVKLDEMKKTIKQLKWSNTSAIQHSEAIGHFQIQLVSGSDNPIIGRGPGWYLSWRNGRTSRKSWDTDPSFWLAASERPCSALLTALAVVPVDREHHNARASRFQKIQEYGRLDNTPCPGHIRCIPEGDPCYLHRLLEASNNVLKDGLLSKLLHSGI